MGREGDGSGRGKGSGIVEGEGMLQASFKGQSLLIRVADV